MYEKKPILYEKGGILVNTKYRIGFFAAVFISITLLGIGYQVSYRYVSAKQQEQEALEKDRQSEDILTAKSDADTNEGFYLCELHGYVAVFLNDKTTLYQLTNISLTSLPGEVQGEIQEGKYKETEKELYAFLENYSS